MIWEFLKWRPWKYFFQKLKDGALRSIPILIVFYLLSLAIGPFAKLCRSVINIFGFVESVPLFMRGTVIFLGAVLIIFVYGVFITSDPVNKHIEPLINKAKPGNLLIELFKIIFKIEELEADYVGVTNTRFPGVLDVVLVTKISESSVLGERMVTVVFPSFPIPLTGGTVNFILESKVVRLDWTLRQAFFWIMSGGKSDHPPIPEKIMHDFLFKQGAFSAFST